MAPARLAQGRDRKPPPTRERGRGDSPALAGAVDRLPGLDPELGQLLDQPVATPPFRGAAQDECPPPRFRGLARLAGLHLGPHALAHRGHPQPRERPPPIGGGSEVPDARPAHPLEVVGFLA